MKIQRAVEKTIEAKLLKGTANIGYYFAATDRAPKPGEFKFLNQGMVVVEDLLVTFTILTNNGQDAVVTAALSMLSAAENASPRRSNLAADGYAFSGLFPTLRVFGRAELDR